MPQLNRILCNIQWRDAATPFPEHGTVYGDGVVETYVVIPNQPQSFKIHVQSKGFIYEGLSVLVFVDGKYHANRNRVNLRPFHDRQALNHTEIDFMFRQKEKSIDGNLYMGREWRFDDHNIVSELPSGVKENHFDDLGMIEVIVLRCRTRLSEEAALSASSSGADTDAFCERPKFEDVGPTDNNSNSLDLDIAEKHNTAEEGVQGGFMSGLFDGADDRHCCTDPSQNHIPQRQNWPSHPDHQPNISQSYVHPPSYVYYPHTPSYEQHWFSSTQLDPPVSKPEKHVHFDFGLYGPPPALHGSTGDAVQSRPPSCDRSRPPTHSPYHKNASPAYLYEQSYALPNRNHSYSVPHPHAAYQAPSADLNRYRDDPIASSHDWRQSAAHPTLAPGPAAYAQQAPNHVPIAIPVPIVANTSYQTRPAFHSWTAPPLTPLYGHLPYRGQQPHYGPCCNRSLHNEVHNEHVNDATLTSCERPATTTQPANNGWNPQQSQADASNQAQDAPNGQNSTWTNAADASANNTTNTSQWTHTEQNSTEPDISNTNNQQNSTGGDGWVGQSQERGCGDGTDAWTNQQWCNDQPNGTPDVNHTGNWGSNNDAGVNDHTSGIDNTNWHNNANNANNDTGGPANDGVWPAAGQEISPDVTSAPDTQPSVRPLHGPHGQYYTWTPRNLDAPYPDAEEEPRFDVPKSVADARGITKQVQSGQGYLYIKKRCIPEYVDSMSDPYARFVFKYRTKEQLQKEIGLVVEMEPTDDGGLQELQNLDRDALIEMLVRAKTALGGKVPSPPANFTQPTATTSAEQNEFVPVDPPIYNFLRYRIPPSRPTWNPNTSNDHTNGTTVTENRNEHTDNWGGAENEQNKTGSSGNTDWNNVGGQVDPNNNIKWTDGSQERGDLTAQKARENQLQAEPSILQQPFPASRPDLEPSTYMPSSQSQNGLPTQSFTKSAPLSSPTDAQSAAGQWRKSNTQRYPSSLSSSPVSEIPLNIDYNTFGKQDGSGMAPPQIQAPYGEAPATDFGPGQGPANPAHNW